MKFVTGIFHSPTHLDEENHNLDDKFQATMGQSWRSVLDGLGRPRLPVTIIANLHKRPESTGPEHVAPPTYLHP